MAELCTATIERHLRRAEDPDNSNQERGRAYEELLEYIVGSVPGTKVRRNKRSHFDSEEIDIAVLNLPCEGSLKGLPELFLVECKNWSTRVGSDAIAAFRAKLDNRCLSLGVLVAANGVTGELRGMTAAYDSGASAMHKGIRLIVLTTDDLRTLQTTDDVVTLLQDRLLDGIAAGTFVLG
ncbi:restriction endonuclease [Nocardia africana]